VLPLLPASWESLLALLLEKNCFQMLLLHAAAALQLLLLLLLLPAEI
jgi:hypothetical protein